MYKVELRPRGDVAFALSDAAEVRGDDPGQEFWNSVDPELIEPVPISHEEDGEVVDFPPVARMVPNALHQAVSPAVE